MEEGFVLAARQIEAAQTVEEIWDLAIAAFEQQNIPRVIYITIASKPPRRAFVLSNMPPEWGEVFRNQENVFDPFIEYCCSTYAITPTGVEFRDDYKYLNDTTHNIFDAAASLGYRSGLAIPMRLRGAARFGGFSLGTDLAREQFEAQIMPHAESLRAFCLIAHRRIEEVAHQVGGAMRVKKLSAREKQSMTLLAGGLKVPRIAFELSLSEAAVRLYLRNAKSKLGADTREEAIAIAMAHGMIEG